MTRFEVGVSYAEWDRTHAALVAALKEARDAGVTEDEARGAVDDVYHEADEDYEGVPDAR